MSSSAHHITSQSVYHKPSPLPTTRDRPLQHGLSQCNGTVMDVLQSDSEHSMCCINTYTTISTTHHSQRRTYSILFSVHVSGYTHAYQQTRAPPLAHIMDHTLNMFCNMARVDCNLLLLRGAHGAVDVRKVLALFGHEDALEDTYV